jgi:hypothetical protein
MICMAMGYGGLRDVIVVFGRREKDDAAVDRRQGATTVDRSPRLQSVSLKINSPKESHSECSPKPRPVFLR